MARVIFNQLQSGSIQRAKTRKDWGQTQNLLHILHISKLEGCLFEGPHRIQGKIVKVWAKGIFHLHRDCLKTQQLYKSHSLHCQNKNFSLHYCLMKLEGSSANFWHRLQRQNCDWFNWYFYCLMASPALVPHQWSTIGIHSKSLHVLNASISKSHRLCKQTILRCCSSEHAASKVGWMLEICNWKAWYSDAPTTEKWNCTGCMMNPFSTNAAWIFRAPINVSKLWIYWH